MEMEIIDNDQTRTYLLKEPQLSRNIIELEDLLTDFVKNETRNAIIDMSNVERIDSMSLAVFLRIKNNLKERSRNFKLVNLTEGVRKVVELASLEIFLMEE